MMEDKTENKTSNVIVSIENAICEGFQSSSPLKANAEKQSNLFNRLVITSLSSDISFISGIAATGLRAGAYLNENELMNNIPQLINAYRQHLPIVVFTEINTSQIYRTLPTIPCFQLFASNHQEAVDFVFLAHKIAEISLIPAMIIAEKQLTSETTNGIIPDESTITQFLGHPDSIIPVPTPSQEMIFGKSRRIIPDWFNPDTPVLTGASKDDKGLGLEKAAKKSYFQRHLPEIITDVCEKFAEATGRQYNTINEFLVQDAEYLLITQGVIFNDATLIANELRENKKMKAGCIHLSMMNPFNNERLKSIIKGKKTTTILEKETDTIYKSLTGIFDDSENTIFSGLYTSELSKEDLTEVFLNMFSNGQQKSYFWTGVCFSSQSSAFPKHEILLQNINRAYPDIKNQSLTAAKNDIDKNEKKESSHTNIIRRYKDQGAPYTKLSRFNDDTSSIYENDNELVADPFQALSSMPPATASLTTPPKREYVPEIMFEKCTGCGSCSVYCPHSALPPIAIGIEDIINGGIAIVSGKGIQITQLTPVIKNLAKVANKEIKDHPEVIVLSEFMDGVFEKTVTQMKLEGDKKKSVKEEFAAVMSEIGHFNFAVTDPFFNNAEIQEKGSGVLFSLSIDPNGCTGCGICAEVCNDEAIELIKESDQELQDIQTGFSLWEQLPDTSSGIINKLQYDDSYDSLAAILLSRNFYYSMTGGSRSENSAPEKTMTHLVTAIAETAIQPKVKDQITVINELILSLNENIHAILSEAIPKDNLGSLTEVIADAQGEKSTFDEIIGKLSTKEQLKLIDTNTLQRKLELINSLKNLLWILTEGPSGTGRSRYGVAISGISGWDMNYPYNNLCSPAMIHPDGSSFDLTLGLIKGHMRFRLDNIKIIRRSELEVKDKYIPDTHDKEIAALEWRDLTDEEKVLIPPILLFVNSAVLEDKYNASLLSLLSEEAPVKVIIFNDCLPAEKNPAIVGIKKRTSLLFSSILQQSAFVLQASLADSDLLLNGLLETFQYPGPAVINILAPNQEDHDTTLHAWPKLFRLALKTRVFPYLKYNPLQSKDFLCSAIDISHNPAPDSNWASESFSLKDNDEEQKIDYSFTWADWAYTITSWKDHFYPYKEEDGAPLPVAEYIRLESASRDGKVPVILRVNETDGIKKYVVSDDVIAITTAALKAWNTIREIGGTLSEFPEKLRNTVKNELAAQHDDEIERLKKEYDEKLKLQEQEQLEKIKVKIRDKLVALSQKGS